jgi:hypothetical protein
MQLSLFEAAARSFDEETIEEIKPRDPVDDPTPIPDKQVSLFDKGEWWQEFWKGMPEFIQEDLTPVKTIYVHFETREDMEAFAKLVDQPLTMNTRSIWYPEAEIGRIANKRYIDELPKELDDDIEVME